MTFYQANSSLLSRSYSTRDEFLKEYNKSYNDKEKSGQLYVEMLDALNLAVGEGNYKNFEKISHIFQYIEDVKNSDESFCLNEDSYAFKKTNIIILACEYKQLKILKYIFSNYSTLFQSLFKNDKSMISPNDEDQNHHNAFYYAIKSGDTKLLDTLMSEWPENYFNNHPNELDEILSKVYEELQLNNVVLSTSMKYFVEKKLIDLRFYSTKSNIQNDTISLENIKDRIELVIEQINSLNLIKDVNEEFLLILKYVAINIFTLKRQLKKTYDTLPWEEIEFTLVCFISCNTEDKEISIFYRVVLNKFKILNHLTNFAKRLADVRIAISDIKKIKSLSSLPNKPREFIVSKIIKNCPEFQELYQDYEKIRDVYTLNEISNCVLLVSSADVKNHEGKLVIIRSLQKIGECLKNTLEAPKLSYSMNKLILSSLPKNTRKLVINLRNSLSHAYSLIERTEIMQNEASDFFNGIKNDVQKIATVINGIFYENNTKTIKNILEGVASCRSVDDLKQIVSVGAQFKISTLSNLLKPEVHLTEHGKFRSIIEKLKNIIPDQTETEKSIIQQMEEVISFQTGQHLNTLENYAVMKHFLTGLKLFAYKINIDNNGLRITKKGCKTILDNLNSSSVQPKDLKSLYELSLKLFESCSLKPTFNKKDDMIKLIVEIFCIIEIQLDNIHWVSKLKDKLNTDHNISSDKIQIFKKRKDKIKRIVTLKLEELKKILTQDDSTKSLEDTIFNYNKQELASVEMLILEILSILGDDLKRLENNLVFLDENIPLLIGKNLRNHLAHDNAILDIVPSNPLVGLAVAAKKFLEELETNENKIGKTTIEDLEKLRNKIDLEKRIISIKQKMFDAIESGNLESLKSYISQGADIRARKKDMFTSLHAAAKGGNLDIVNFLIERKIDIEVATIDGRTPLHVAAEYGQASVVEFFVKQNYYKVECCDESLKTPLHFAALNNHRITVETLLKYNANCSAQDICGSSPLHYAILENYKEVAQLIILKRERNVDANEARGGFTSLHIASERGFTELVSFLLNRGAYVGATTDNRLIPLHLASFNGHTEVVDILVAKKSNVNARTHDGCTPLHYATEHGHKTIVDVLLKNGADPNVSDKTYYNTPLHYAAQDGYVDIAEALINYKANVNAVDVHGQTPLFYAIAKGHIKIVKMICQHDKWATKKVKFALLFAILQGSFEIVEYLISSLKMDVNVTNDEGFTPLHYAAFKGHKDVVALLVKNKAEINAKNYEGSTPLLEAIGGDINQIVYNLNLPPKTRKKLLPNIENHLKKGQSVGLTNCVIENNEVVDILLKNGADINAKTNAGKTAMHLAALSGKYSVVNLLINRKISVNIKDNLGGTPLLFATMANHKEVVLLLLANGAEINCTDEMGMTPLHSACIMGFSDIVKILLTNNANLNAENIHKLTPLFYAVHGDHVDVVRIITSKTQVRVNDSYLHLAIDNNNTDILQILLDYKRSIMKSVMKNNSQEEISLLYRALIKSSEHIINTLIENGADVNAKGLRDSTPLFIAVLGQRENIVKLLLDKGANIRCTNFEGSTVLHTAAINGNPEIVEVLLKEGADVNAKDYKKRTALELAVAGGHLEMVKLLLPRAKMNINSKVNNGFTLLHIAAQWNHVEVIKCLVKNGADINVRNEGGSKPIHIAAREGFEESVKYFLDLGQDINELGTSNTNLLHTCALSSNVSLAEYLIKRGANVNSRSLLGRTPLHNAIQMNAKVDFVKLLLEHGAMYNATDLDGGKPIDFAMFNPAITNLLSSIDDLFKAVKGNNAAEVKRCIEAGVIVNALNADNVTALHFASWKGFDDVVAELVQDEKVINVLGKSGFTALHFAAKYGHFNVCKMLLGAGAIYNLSGANKKTPLDFSVNEDITKLLTTIDDCFEKVSKKNISVVNDIKKIKDVTVVKAIMNASRNEGRKSLVTFAIQNDFPKVEELKGVLQDDLSDQLSMADILVMREQYREALKIYELALKRRTELLGKSNPGTLDIETKIASMLYKQQKYSEALDMCQGIYEKKKDLLGEDSKEALETRSFTALILHRQGRNEEALLIIQQVHEKQKNILPTNDRDFLNTRLHMGLILQALGKFDEALEVNTKVFEDLKNTLGSNHPDTLSAQNNIAMVLGSQGEYEQAERIYRKVYESLKKYLGPTHSDTLRAFGNIVALLQAQKKYNEALNAYEELLKVQKSCLGSDHIDTLRTQLRTSMLLLDQGKHVSSFAIINKCLPAFKKKLGPNHKEVLAYEKVMEVIKMSLQFSGQSDLMDITKNLNAEARAAVKSGDLKAVQQMLECDIDVNEADEEGRTLMHFAANNGNVDIARALLNSGCVLTAATKKGNTPLHTAVCRGHAVIVKEFFKHLNRLELRDFINAKTTVSGTTALHVAAKEGDYEIVYVLLKCRAMYCPKNSEGKTPLDVAQNQRIVRLLKLIDSCFEDVMNGNAEVISKLRDMEGDEFLATTNARNDQYLSLKQVATTRKNQKIANEVLATINWRNNLSR